MSSLKDQVFMEMAFSAAKLSKCVSIKVGAILVRDDRVVSMGVNGTVTGVINCCDKFPQWKDAGYITDEKRQEHHDWSLRNEVHSELNCILAAAKNGIKIEGSTMFSTLQPCSKCLPMLVQAGVKRIVYSDEYCRAEYGFDDNEVKEMLLKNNIVVEKFSL